MSIEIIDASRRTLFNPEMIYQGATCCIAIHWAPVGELSKRVE